MISQFLVCIQGGLGSLFLYLYLLGGLTLFGEKQQREREYILYFFPHPHSQTHLSFFPLHCHANPIASVLNLSVLFCYFHYP